MQKLFPPVSETATAGSASPDTPTPQSAAPEPPEAPAPTPVRPFAWPPPEEDLDDWHVFQFGETPSAPAAAPGPPAPASPAAAAPTLKLSPSQAPTLKLVSSHGEPARPAEPAAEVEAPLAHLDVPSHGLEDSALANIALADTAELGSAKAPLPETLPIITPFAKSQIVKSDPVSAVVAAPESFGTPDTAPLATPLFSTPKTAPIASPFATPETGPMVAPVFTSPITAPMPVPTDLATPPPGTFEPTVTAPVPALTTRRSSAGTSLGLSGALNETGTNLPARRGATPPLVPVTTDPPLMSATVDVITRSAQAQVQPAKATRGSWWWLRRAVVTGLALLAIGEAAYIATLRLRTPPAVPLAAALFVQSQPAGAEILVDGQLRGKTPFRLDLPPGQHVLELRKDKLSRRFPLVLAAGTQISQYVEMRGDAEATSTPPTGASAGTGASTPAGETTTPAAAGATSAAAAAAVQTPPAPVRPVPTMGWLLVQSSIQLSVLRNGESIGNSDDGRLALGAGNQELELSNTAAGYREATTIRILPGQVTTLRPELPQSTIDIESTPTARVSIDGRDLGETPLAQIALTIGPHDILFRHADFPERHVSTFIKVATPAHVSVDLGIP